MNKKQILGIVITAVGLALTAFAINGMRQLSSAEQVFGEAKQMLSSHPIGKRVGSSLQDELDIAGKKVKFAFYGGILLVVAGAATFFVYRKR